MNDVADNPDPTPEGIEEVAPEPVEASTQLVPDMHDEQATTEEAPPPPPKPNRRAQKRYLAHWRAALVGDNVKHMGRTDNVSLSGAGIIADVNLHPRQEFRVYFEIPTQPGKPAQIFEAVGTVVHSMLSQGSFKIGIAFTFFVDDSDKMLRAALSSGRYKELFDPTFS